MNEAETLALTQVGSEETEIARLREEVRCLRDLVAGTQRTEQILSTTQHQVTEQARELSRTRQDMEQQTRLLNTVLASIVDFAYTFNCEGRFTYVNQSLLDLWQIKSEDALGKNFFELGYPAELAAHLHWQIETVLRTGQPLKDETPYTGAAGTNGYYEYILVPVFDAAGEVEAVAGSTRDTSDRKRAEEAVHASEAKYRALFDSMEEGFCVIEKVEGTAGELLDFRYVEANQAFTAHSGLSDVVGKTIRQAVPGEREEWFDTYDSVLRTGESVRFERGLITQGRVLELYAYRVAGVVQDHVAVLFHDITRRKQTEEQRILLEHETTLLAERNRMAQELHDTLAQGYTGIRMQLDVAQDILQVSSDIEGALQHIVRAREIAQRSQMEARSSIRGLRSPLLDNATLIEAFERLAVEADTVAQVLFRLEGTPYALSSMAENDIYRVGQEALTNALRHSQAQSIVLSLDYRADRVRLDIQDDGQGFDRKAQRAGFGITGLQERALRMGADLHIASQPGQGTQVTLTLPLPSGQGEIT